MSKRTLILCLVAGLALLISPGGVIGGSLQLALVATAGISAIKDFDEDDD